MRKLTKKQFALSYKENAPRVFGLAFKMLQDSGRAEDVMQETFLRLSKADVSSIKGEMIAWLFTVAKNLSIKIWYKEKRYFYLNIGEGWHFREGDKDDSDYYERFSSVVLRLTDVELSPSAADIYAEEEEEKAKIALIKSLLAKLPKNMRKVVRLRFFENLSYEETAKRMRTSAGNVGFLLNAAKSKMLKYYKGTHIGYEREDTYKYGGGRGKNSRADDHIQPSKQG